LRPGAPHDARRAVASAVSVRIDRPGEIGEYDEGLQVMLQLVWGEGFLSPGGAQEVARVLEGLDIHGRSVLDIGSGLGGVDVLLVQQHGAGRVVGIDLEPDLIAQARVRVARLALDERIEFRQVRPGPLPFGDASFDVVFSKDSLVQIPDKAALFAEIRRVLMPRGLFVAGDWLRGGSSAYSAQMLEFFRLEGITYNLASAEDTVRALRVAGFTDVEVRDHADWYRALAQGELASMKGEWFPVMEQRLGHERAQHFVANWQQMVLVLESGELRPAHVTAWSAP
jgi:ubiquinone/menaquinone biosynthesis C-methylase UbiE